MHLKIATGILALRLQVGTPTLPRIEAQPYIQLHLPIVEFGTHGALTASVFIAKYMVLQPDSRRTHGGLTASYLPIVTIGRSLYLCRWPSKMNSILKGPYQLTDHGII